MNNGEYWQKRFELLEQAAHQQGVQCYADIEKPVSYTHLDVYKRQTPSLLTLMILTNLKF